MEPLTMMLFTNALTSVGQGFSQANSIRAQNSYNATMGELNQRLSEFQSDNALRMGEQNVFSQRKKTNQVIGAQRAALAAQGIDVESGSALDIQEQTRLVSEQDVSTIKINAYRQAWGYKAQALNLQYQTQFGTLASENAATASLMGGITRGAAYGLQGAYSQWGRKIPGTNDSSTKDNSFTY